MTSTSRVANPDRLSYAVSPGKRTLTMALPSGAGQALPDADSWSSRMGADVSGARVVTGGAAESAAADIGARAFTVGKTIYFGQGAYDPSSASGQHLMAHELAHTLQQPSSVPTGGALPASQPGDGAERAAHAAADAVAAGRRAPAISAGGPMVAGDWLPDFPFRRAGGIIVSPSGPVQVPSMGPHPRTNAGGYLQTHGRRHGEELPPNMGRVSFSLPSPYVTWKSGDSSTFARAVGEELMQKILAAKAEEVLTPAVAPANLWEIVNTAREDDALDHPEQADEYHLSVTMSIVNTLRERVIESLARMVPRYVNEWNRRTIEDRQRRSTSGRRSAAENPEDNNPGTAVRQSHPIDWYVLQALSGPNSGKLIANFLRYRKDFPAEAQVTDRQEPKPIRAFTWLNQQGAANWIRVTDPADAAVEDVALEMYGAETMSWKITPAAPLFGLEPMGLKPEHYRVLSANGGGTSSDRPGGGPQTLPQQLLSGPLADEAALAQAKGFSPGAADASALTQQFDQIVVHFGNLQGKVGRIGEETDKLEAAKQRVVERKRRITGGQPSEIQAWSGQAREQLDVLVKCIDGVDLADRVHASVKDQPQGQFEATLLHDHIARRYSRAASISDMVSTARAMMVECERDIKTFVVDWLDDVFRWLRGAIINSRVNRRTGGAQDPSLAVPELDRRETEIRNELQALREILLTNPEAAQARIDAIYQKLNDLSVEVALVRNIDACDEAWSNLKGGRSTMGWIRGLAPGDHGNERLENLQGEANEFDAAWAKMLADWRAGKRKEATDALAALSTSPKWKSFFERVSQEIKDQAEWDRFMIFMAMIGIAIVSMGAGTFAAGLVGGGVLGFVVGLATEVTVFTALSHGLIEKEHSLSGFWSQWKKNLGIFLVLRGIAGAFKLAGAAGGMAEITAQYAAINGIALYDANQAKVRAGRGALSAGEILDISLENLMFMVGVSIAGSLVQPWMSRLALRGEIGRRVTAVETLGRNVSRLADRVQSSHGKDRAAAQQLLDRQAELLEKEGTLLDELIRIADNPAAANEHHLTGDQIAKIQEARGRLADSRRQVALARLFASLEPVSNTSFLIARDGAITRARADFEAQIGHEDAESQAAGEGVKSVSEISTDNQTQSRSFTVEMKDGSSFRISEKLGDARMEQGSRPNAPGASDAAPLGSECFVAGTLVATPGGPVAIESVRPGQEILTRDLDGGRVVSATVLGCMASAAQRVLELEVAGETIRCTGGHPFWVPGAGWSTASDLRPGTPLMTASGAAVEVAAIRRIAGGATVYNMEVGGLHTYLVSAAQILVHNKAMRWMLTDRAASLRPRAQALLAEVQGLPANAPGRVDLLRDVQALQPDASDLTGRAEARGATEATLQPHEGRIADLEENLVRLEEAVDVASLPGRSFDLPQRIFDLRAQIDNLPDSEPSKWELRQKAQELGEEAQTARDLMEDAENPADLQNEIESIERRARDLEESVRQLQPEAAEGATEPRPHLRYPRNHLPTGGTHPYEPPAQAGSPEVVAHPEGNGFLDRFGNRWEWARDQHAGPHWDVQHPDGTHTNVYPDGMVHQGADNF